MKINPNDYVCCDKLRGFKQHEFGTYDYIISAQFKYCPFCGCKITRYVEDMSKLI